MNEAKERIEINADLRDYFASQAMLSAVSETQEVVPASFWDWCKQLLQQLANMTFLTVKYKDIPDVYEGAARRCFEYADAMINERNK